VAEQRNLILTRADQLFSTRQKWLETEVLPMGTLTNFVGAGGCGKTTKAIDTAARATRGELEGDLLGEPRNVLFIGHEDDKGTQMKPRLQAAGAVLERIIFMAVASGEDKFTMELVPTLPLDIDLIRNAITETDAALIIIDPLTRARCPSRPESSPCLSSGNSDIHHRDSAREKRPGERL
jgi:hypothetical protein